MLEMILNELSLQPAPDAYVARQWMMAFVQTVKTATGHGVARSLRTQRGIFDIALAADYPFASWLHDGDVDREMRRYVHSLSTKAPFWDGLPELYDQVSASEFHFGDRPASGLGVAYMLEDLAVSLPSANCWDAARLDLHVMSLVEAEGQDEGDIEEEDVRVIHASRETHVDGGWIRDRLQRDIQDGDGLWARRAELLPRLAFCDAVGPQVRSLGTVMLPSVARRLFELDGFCRDWTEGGFDTSRLPNATPESESTLRQYGHERTFRDPDDLERTFSWHVRLTPNAWRVYFDPVPGTRTMIIGYIGPHLRTVRYH